jgi:hypothetical protein
MKRAFVFIDGNNLYFKLKKLIFKSNKRYSLLKFDFKQFCEWLSESNKLVEVHYYLGAIRRKVNDEKFDQLAKKYNMSVFLAGNLSVYQKQLMMFDY